MANLGPLMEQAKKALAEIDQQQEQEHDQVCTVFVSWLCVLFFDCLFCI